ncbi:hypothetical protein GW796_07410 [archaeon]|nr:hypothetical protein [archaeon]NCQ51711.1 hypothetical protein [archaeon]
MTLNKVIANLENTIAGKNILLANYSDMQQSLSREMDAYQKLYETWHVTIEMLKINIDELKRILADILAVK